MRPISGTPPAHAAQPGSLLTRFQQLRLETLLLHVVALLLLALPAGAQQDTLRQPGGPPPGDVLLGEDVRAGDPAVPQTFDWWRAGDIPAATPWGQQIDARATELMRSWTTRPEYTNRFVDHLPVAPGVVSPMDHFGYPIGRPGHLHSVQEIYGYHEALAASSPRVNFNLLGTTEEGNRLALVQIGSAENLARLDRVREGMNALADPRRTSPEEARRWIAELPVIHTIYSGLHSPETGQPETTMELAYRLAASEDPMIRAIRDSVVVFIVPVVEPDGRNRVVDWYRLHGLDIVDFEDRIPGPPFWGKYIRHDNNRDGLQMIARLTQEMLALFTEWKFPIGLDMHESVPYLYVSTGTGPYNPNLDPITISEWQWIANYEVTALTALGKPGVWTHGFYDGWNPSYLLWQTNNRNAIGRFYETFGNSLPHTMRRELPDALTEVRWYRPNPPRTETIWSLRNNVNYGQTGVLHSLHLYSQNRSRILEQFWTKSNNSLQRGRTTPPFAFHLPTDQPRKANVEHLLNNLRRQGIEVQRADAGGTFGDVIVRRGDYLVRMDQPYRDYVQTLMGIQRFPENAPRPYDDVGWTFGHLYNVTVNAVAERAVQELDAALMTDRIAIPGRVDVGRRVDWYAVSPAASAYALGARFELGDVPMHAAEEAIEARGRSLPAGTWLLPASATARDRVEEWARRHGFDLVGLTDSQLRGVARAEMRLPRIAVLHSWRNTQDDGWVRFNLDQSGVPYTYLPEDRLAGQDLRADYDVILFPEQGRASTGRAIFAGVDPKFSPLPYLPDPAYPALGVHSQTADITGGMGYEGLAALRDFMHAGGTFITLGSATTLPVELGLVRDVTLAEPPGLFVPGSVVQGRVVRAEHPIAWGYDERVPLINRFGPYLEVPDALDDRVVVRYAAADELFLSGLVINGAGLADRPAVVALPVGAGRAVLFGFNPLHRYQTHGMFSLAWNALLHWDRL
jgi:hypothetical protein